MKIIIVNILILLLLILNSSLHCHQDTFIKIENGKMLGLPEKYSPATINIDSLLIMINGKELEFPPWFNINMMKVENYDLEILASWYHDLTIVPPIITFKFINSKKGFAYNFVFNLDTKEIYNIIVSVEYAEGVWRNHKLDLEYN